MRHGDASRSASGVDRKHKNNIRVDLPEAGGDRSARPPDVDPPVIPRRMRLTWEMFERFGLTVQCLGFRAIRTGVGYPANHTERCRERIEQKLEKEPEGASKVARDRERLKRARHEDRARDMRGASSARDGAGNEQKGTGRPVAMSESQPRPAEPSVGDDQPPRQQSDDADMADPDSDRRRPRASLGEERETKRVRMLSLGVASACSSVQSCTMNRSAEEPGYCTISLGDALQLSLSCTIRLECMHDVFHALGNARDRRDGERVSFLTNSSHIARKVEGSKLREDMDSEICEGLRQQVGDVGHTSAMMHWRVEHKSGPLT